MKLKNRWLKQNNIIIITIIIIMMITFYFLNHFGTKITKNSINQAKIIIDEKIITTINDSVRTKYLNNADINSLIKIKMTQNEISNVDYDTNETYKLLSTIKKEILAKQGINRINNFVPFYSYKNNILLSQFGPKIPVQIQLIQSINGSVKTIIKSYGINFVLLELYLVIEIKSNIYIPTDLKTINNNYEILITSKVIQGKIPHFYNGMYESSSKKLDT